MADVSKLRDFRSSAPHPDTAVTERPQGGSNKDPLAELARLIGKDDLFEQMRRDATRVEQGPAPAGPAEEHYPEVQRTAPVDYDADELRGAYEPNRAEPTLRLASTETLSEPVSRPHRYEAAELEQRSAASGHYAYAEQPAPDANGAAHPYADPAHDPHAAAYTQPEYYDPAEAYDEQAYEEPPPERKRTGLKIFAAVAGLAMVGAAGAYGYRSLSSGDGGQPPVIKASVTPTKVAPAQQGAAPAARTTYDRADRSQPARVVSSEEQPVELREARTAAPRVSAPGASAGATLIGAPGAATTGLAAQGISTGLADAGEPKKVKTIAIRPDGTPASQPATARPPAPRTTAGAPSALAPQAQGAASGPTRTASIPSTTARAAAGGSHVVQVASQKSEEDAQASFRSLQAKFPGVLGDRQPMIRRTDLGERGIFYRVQVGPFTSAEQANEVCGNLKAAGGQCIVQRN